MKKLLVGLAFAAVAASGAGVAQAQNVPMQQDGALINAINQMAGMFGGGCQQGLQGMCQGYQYIMSNAGAMSQASNACQQGNQQGCQYYMQYYAQMEHDYSHFQQAVASSQYSGGGYGGGYSGGSPLGATHQDRMQAIQNFGAQNTQNYQARMSQMDSAHSSWMQSQGYAH